MIGPQECGALVTGHYQDEAWFCVRFVGHEGDHVASNGATKPREDAWPN